MEDKTILVVLAEICKKHAATHHRHRQDEAQSEGCQRDLDHLSTLIPKVETAYLKSTQFDDLCDFYNDVLSGGFCPYAPNLFNGGVDDCKLESRSVSITCSARYLFNTSIQYSSEPLPSWNTWLLGKS